MIQRIWMLCGRVAYWCGWPLLWLYLYRTRRTRVLVICGNDVLVVRGWLGDGQWGLPGGGLRRNEQSRTGAIRELKEETNIEVRATDLQKLFTNEKIHHHGFTYAIDAYVLPLSSKPDMRKQQFEITHVSWLDRQELLGLQRGNTEIKKILSAFYKK